MGTFAISNTAGRFGVQAQVGIPAISLPYQFSIVTETAAPTTQVIPNPELRRGTQISSPIPGSLLVGGTMQVTLRPSDLQVLIAQVQRSATRTPLGLLTTPPGPTGAYLLELSPQESTVQLLPFTLEFWRDEDNGSMVIYDVFISSQVHAWSENALVTAVFTIEGAGATYWDAAEARGLNDVPEVHAVGYPHPERRVTDRPGSTGDLTIELVAETSPGIWDARAMVGRFDVIDIVDTTNGSPILTTASPPGSVDFRDLVHVDDWVSVQDEGAAYKVAAVTETTVTLATNFSATLVGKRLMLAWGEPGGAGATFEVRSGQTREGRPFFHEVIATHDGLLFGENNKRTRFTTAGNEIPTGDTLALTGTVSVTIATTAWTGVGTLFLTEVATGSTIVDGSGNAYTVNSVIDNENLTVQKPAVAGLSGATVGVRRQWVIARDRQEWALIEPDEKPLKETKATILFGTDPADVEEVEVTALTVTITPPRPAAPVIGSPYPGVPTESGQRAVAVSVTMVYDDRTQGIANRIEQQGSVAMVIRSTTGSPVIEPVPESEVQVARLEGGITWSSAGLVAAGQRQTAAAPGRNLLTVALTGHPNAQEGTPDIKVDIITDAPNLVVEP